MHGSKQWKYCFDRSKTYLRTAWFTEISILFWGLWTIYYKVYVIFFKKVLVILRQSTKHVNFWLGVQFPLNMINRWFLMCYLNLHMRIINLQKFRFLKWNCIFHCILVSETKHRLAVALNFIFQNDGHCVNRDNT